MVENVLMSGNLTRIVLRVIVIVGAIALATKGGYDLLWLLLVPPVAWDTYRTIQPGPPQAPAAEFTAPGRFRVVLQVPGNRQIQVIQQIRRTTTLGLVEARQLLAEAPAVVVEGLSEESAELVADRLRAAGARARAAPLGEM
jgi:ribosomal protein L7/L12